MITNKVTSINELIALGKGTPSNSTGADLAASVNALRNARDNSDIAVLLRKAVSGEASVNYVVSGDSTRDSNRGLLQHYYKNQLAKINVQLDYNAESGQSGYHWAYNVDETTVDQAIALIPGTGSNTILELSLGINDYKATDRQPDFDYLNPAHIAQIKADLQTGITALITAKPALHLVLAAPVFTAYDQRNIDLPLMYQQLSTENNLPLIESDYIMEPVHPSPDFYDDTTHPSENGSKRLCNHILNQLLPTDLATILTLGDAGLTAPPQAGNLNSPTIEVGYWSTTTGGPNSNASWRRLADRIPVVPGMVMRIAHQGSRNDCLTYDANDVYIGKVTMTVVGGYLHFITGDSVYFLRVNLQFEDLIAYDALNDLPSVIYRVPDSNSLTSDQINSGSPVSLRQPSSDVVGAAEVVSIAGGLSVGSELRAYLVSGWAVTGYQWQLDNVDIGGATSPSYTVLAGDAGKVINCTVTGLSRQSAPVRIV